MLPFKTYSENLRWAMKNAEVNRHGVELRPQDVAAATGYSYEQIRKMFHKFPAMSQECNDIVCEFIGGLPKDEMWEMAKAEKIAKKLGYKPMQLPDPLGQRFERIWKQFSDDQRQFIVKVAEGLASTDNVSV